MLRAVWLGDPLVPQLAKAAKVGWSRPERLSGMSALLNLKAVEVESGGSSNPRLRVAALPSVLGKAVKRLPDSVPDGPLAGKNVAEAAAALLDVPTPQPGRSLSDRREAAAKVCRVEPETFRRHLQTPVLAHVADALRALSGEQLLEGAASSTAAGQAVRDALGAYYGAHASQLATLVKSVLPQTVHYDDVSVELVLQDHPEDRALYQLEYRSGFLASLDEYVVAFVQRAALSDRIMATCPKVNDAWAFSDREGLEKQTRTLHEGESSVRVLGEDAEGRPFLQALDLQPVERKSSRDYLTGLGDIDIGEVTLLRSAVPRTLAAPAQIATQYRFDMRRDDHYCYWVAPRPLFLRRLTFNYTQLGRTGRVIVQPFMGKAASRPEWEGQLFRLEVDDWVVPGQGAVMTWSGDNE